MNSPFQDEKSERLFGLIQMLQRTALVNMGGIPDHEGQIHFNLGEAKAAIDAIDAIDSIVRRLLVSAMVFPPFERTMLASHLGGVVRESQHGTKLCDC